MPRTKSVYGNKSKRPRMPYARNEKEESETRDETINQRATPVFTNTNAMSNVQPARPSSLPARAYSPMTQNFNPYQIQNQRINSSSNIRPGHDGSEIVFPRWYPKDTIERPPSVPNQRPQYMISSSTITRDNDRRNSNKNILSSGSIPKTPQDIRKYKLNEGSSSKLAELRYQFANPQFRPGVQQGPVCTTSQPQTTTPRVPWSRIFDGHPNSRNIIPPAGMYLPIQNSTVQSTSHFDNNQRSNSNNQNTSTNSARNEIANRQSVENSKSQYPNGAYSKNVNQLRIDRSKTHQRSSEAPVSNIDHSNKIQEHSAHPNSAQRIVDRKKDSRASSSTITTLMRQKPIVNSKTHTKINELVDSHVEATRYQPDNKNIVPNHMPPTSSLHAKYEALQALSQAQNSQNSVSSNKGGSKRLEISSRQISMNQMQRLTLADPVTQQQSYSHQLVRNIAHTPYQNLPGRILRDPRLSRYIIKTNAPSSETEQKGETSKVDSNIEAGRTDNLNQPDPNSIAESVASTSTAVPISTNQEIESPQSPNISHHEALPAFRVAFGKFFPGSTEIDNTHKLSPIGNQPSIKVIPPDRLLASSSPTSFGPENTTQMHQAGSTMLHPQAGGSFTNLNYNQELPQLQLHEIDMDQYSDISSSPGSLRIVTTPSPPPLEEISNDALPTTLHYYSSQTNNGNNMALEPETIETAPLDLSRNTNWRGPIDALTTDIIRHRLYRSRHAYAITKLDNHYKDCSRFMHNAGNY